MSTRRKLAIGILFPVVLLSLTLDQGGRGRFCPKTLEYQTQSERTILWGIPIYRSEWEPTEAPQLIADLVDAGLVTPMPGTPDRWILMFHYNGNWKDGYSLLHGLFTRQSYDLLEWSRDNPEVAKVYWAEAFRLMRSEDRHERNVAASFMMLARSSTNIAELEKTIRLARAEVESYRGE